MRWSHIKGKNKKPKDLRPFVSANASKVVAEPAQGILGNKMHKGLPLLTREEYNALNSAAESNRGTVQTFDFRGYIQYEDGTKYYVDTIVISGLRGGAFVRINGLMNGRCIGVTDPSDINEYEVMVNVPPEAQKSEGVVCRYDQCHTVEEFLRMEKEHHSEKEAAEELARCQSHEGWIVCKLGIDPEEDPEARSHVYSIATEIKRYFSMGLKLDQLGEFIHELDRVLLDRLLTDIAKERPE